MTKTKKDQYSNRDLVIAIGLIIGAVLGFIVAGPVGAMFLGVIGLTLAALSLELDKTMDTREER